MSITATELKNNLGRYLELALTEDIVILKNGHPQAVLSNPRKQIKNEILNLRGCLSCEKSLEEFMDERASKI